MTAMADPTIRRQVVATAREVLRRQPGAPVARIAREAGVSRATFYRHFGSRQALLDAVDVEPPTSARERVLDAAAQLIGINGLRGLNMDELATRAGVSRATLYRLFPTKAALFGEIVRVYSPFEPVLAVLDANAGRPPDEMVPKLARAFVDTSVPRLGILRGVLLEAMSVTPDAVSGVQPFVPEAIGRIAAYLQRQMDNGAIRHMHPILAVQVILGPIFIHILTRPLAERLIGLSVPMDQAVDQLSAAILEGLRA
jgi:AcrR family transcriptional regulator